jgi:hypothetical protein
MDTGWFFYNVLMALTNKPETNGDAGKDEQKTIQKAKHGVVTLQNAFDTWSAAHDKFTSLFDTGADVKQVTISTDDLATYENTVAGLFAAAHKLEEDSQFVSTSVRETYHKALHIAETAWANFASEDDGHINGDAFVPFLNDLAAFMKARNEYCKSDKRLRI